MKRAETWGRSCYAETARRRHEREGYGITAGAPRGSGQSLAEPPSPTVERSTPAWVAAGRRGRAEHERAPSPLGSHWSERRRGAGHTCEAWPLLASGGAGAGRGVRAPAAVRPPVIVNDSHSKREI